MTRYHASTCYSCYVKFHHLVTLDDFIYMIQVSDWEQSLTEHLEQVISLKGNRIALARFKSAFESGQQALKHAAQVAPKRPSRTPPSSSSTWIGRSARTLQSNFARGSKLLWAFPQTVCNASLVSQP